VETTGRANGRRQWRAESADYVRLAKLGDPQGHRMDVMRIQRVYDRRPFSNQEDALNSVRAFYDSLAPNDNGRCRPPHAVVAG
jgi:hypothetical protein